jgi:hypothetical protein
MFYSHHAETRMFQYGIRDEDLVAAIAEPDCKWRDLEGRTVVRTRIRGRQLCIVYELGEDWITVVTAYPTEEEAHGDQDRRVVG